MEAHYLEQMQAHIDDGGKLGHKNAVDLLKEVWKLRAKNTQKYRDALQDIEDAVCGPTFDHINNKVGINADITSEDINRLVGIIDTVKAISISALALKEFTATA